TFTERDPLVAAKWFARAAADELSTQSADLKTAERHQRQASAALSRAWDQTIHQAAAERLAGLPTMQPVFAAGLPTDTSAGGGLAPTTRPTRSFLAQEWL